MKIVNCTPHDINVLVNHDFQLNDKNRIVNYPSNEKTQLRLLQKEQTKLTLPQFSDVNVFTCQEFFGVDKNLSDIDGDALIVSMPIGQYFAKNRGNGSKWILGPDTGPQSAVRDDQGGIKYVRRLVLYAAPEQSHDEQ